MTAYYNEIDPYAAQWLRNLIAAGHIAPGDVDERSIVEVYATDLLEYTQCHFFAGIGGWSHALRLADWPDERPVWTGSCPCQPFSAAGKRKGTADDRHLWPYWFQLIRKLKPVTVFGEQVASKDALAWFDAVQSDLERESYTVGAVDLPACGVGAPHIRNRLWFVGHAVGERSGRDAGAVLGAQSGFEGGVRGEPDGTQYASNARECNGFWSDAEWIYCRDGKRRPAQPGVFPLAHGAAARVGRLRAYGNAIVAPVAVEVIRAYMKRTKESTNR